MHLYLFSCWVSTYEQYRSDARYNKARVYTVWHLYTEASKYMLYTQLNKETSIFTRRQTRFPYTCTYIYIYTYLAFYLYCTFWITLDRSEIWVQDLYYYSTALVEEAKSLAFSNVIGHGNVLYQKPPITSMVHDIYPVHRNVLAMPTQGVYM